MLHFYRWLLLVMVSAACTQELDITLPTTPSQLVLNGLLHPDSTIQVSLTTTLPSSSVSTDFLVVDNALVRLYEDSVLISELVFADSIYILDYYPKAGREYRIDAIVPGCPTVRASDIIPNPPNVEICIREDTAKRYPYSGIMDITIRDSHSENNYYWFYNLNFSYAVDSCFWNRDKRERECILADPPRLQSSDLGYYYSYSPVPDRFNAFVDNTVGGVTQFDFYIRVDDASQNGEDITFDVASGDQYIPAEEFFKKGPNSGEISTLYAISGSQHYDRYLKSSITYLLNRNYSEDEDLGFKPFVQASQVYSNVENGMGIFAAYNTTDLDMGSYLCE